MATADTPQPATPVKACGFSVSIARDNNSFYAAIICESSRRFLSITRFPAGGAYAETRSRGGRKPVTSEQADMIEALAIRCITDPPPAVLFDLVYGYFDK